MFIHMCFSIIVSSCASAEDTGEDLSLGDEDDLEPCVVPVRRRISQDLYKTPNAGLIYRKSINQPAELDHRQQPGNLCSTLTLN